LSADHADDMLAVLGKSADRSDTSTDSTHNQTKGISQTQTGQY